MIGTSSVIDIQRINPKIVDMVGKRFGKLLVIEYAHRSVRGKAFWICKCDCGKLLEVSGDQLRRGKTRSCGCLVKTHGMWNSTIYKLWDGIKKRCLNPNSKSYHNYGGRGITICEDWLNFENFYFWAISNGYKKGLQIDRINNMEGYYPENCRFVLPKQNARNRRTNRLIEINGEVKTLIEWAEIAGIHRCTLRDRIKNGWPKEMWLDPPRK